MVLDFVWEISTTLIIFGYSNGSKILLAIFTIVIMLIVNAWFRSKFKQKPKKSETQRNDEIMRQGLQACFKQAQHKLIEKKLSTGDLDREKEKETQTLNEVFKLFQNRKDLFPESSLDDLKQQLNLYRKQ